MNAADSKTFVPWTDPPWKNGCGISGVIKWCSGSLNSFKMNIIKSSYRKYEKILNMIILNTQWKQLKCPHPGQMSKLDFIYPLFYYHHNHGGTRCLRETNRIPSILMWMRLYNGANPRPTLTHHPEEKLYHKYAITDQHRTVPGPSTVLGKRRWKRITHSCRG